MTIKDQYDQALREIKEEYDSLVDSLLHSGRDKDKAEKDALLMQIESYRWMVESWET